MHLRSSSARETWALVPGAVGIYLAASFAYPLGAGESILHTALRRCGGELSHKA